MTAGISTMNTDEPKRPLSRQEANRQGQGSPGPPSDGTTRTSGSDGRFCQECGAMVTGRRRNGFCSARCRVRARRQERDSRIDALRTTAEACLSTLRVELGRGRTQEGDRTQIAQRKRGGRLSRRALQHAPGLGEQRHAAGDSCTPQPQPVVRPRRSRSVH